MAEQEMLVVLGADISDFQSAMGKVQDSMKDTAKNVQNSMDGAESAVSSSMGGIKSALKGLAGIVATAFAVDKIIDFGKNMVEVTAEAQALESQYEQVMGNMKKDTDKYLNRMGKSWNKHPKELKSAYTQYVAILKSKGVEETKSHELAQQMLERTVDANAFANEDMADTTARFMGMVKGEYDSLDSAMVNLSATMLNDKSVELYGKKFDELTVEQQETLKVQEALRQHTSAGVFEQGIREADSYANNLAMVKNQWNDLLVVLGTPILDVVNNALKGISTTLNSIKTEGLANTLKNAVPPEFHGSIELARESIHNLALAFQSADVGLMGVYLGKAFGKAIQSIQGLGKEIGIKISETLQSGELITEIQSGAKTFAISLANILNDDIAEALKNGDWSEVSTLLGQLIGDSITSLLANAGELAGDVGNFILAIFDSLSWGELGAKAVLHSVDFVLGFVMALLDPIVWFTIIKEHWDDILILLLTFFTGGLTGLLGKLAPALAKIPLGGKFMEWIATSFDNLLAPARGKIGGWFSDLWSSLKTGVSSGMGKLFDEGTVLGTWLGKLKGFWGGITTNFTQNFTILKAKVQTFGENLVTTLGKPFEGIAKLAETAFKKVGTFLGNLWTNVKRIAGNIKSKVSNMLTGIKVPKISLTTKTRTILKKEITYPTGFNVSWHKDGGIVKGTQGGTILGLGEDGGDEAIVPLSNKSRMKPFAEAVASMIDRGHAKDGTVINNYFTINATIREELDIKRVTREIQRDQEVAMRAKGSVFYAN